jgi:hypothetical protein
VKIIKVYPEKIYTTLARACRYGGVLPNYVQPVFKEFGSLMHERVGFAVGSEKRGDTWLSYRVRG